MIKDLLHIAEEKYLALLESFFKKIWADTDIPSHDLNHHRRVWEYAREIISYIYTDVDCPVQTFIDKLIIGCFMHDTGMSVDHGEKHGRISSEICEIFLKENDLDLQEYGDLLKAIDYHDNKEYQENSASNRLLHILSTADDLDAFGQEGIDRYSEIYQKRGFSGNELCNRITDNAHQRFRNFKLNFEQYPQLFEKHQIRFNILIDFFRIPS